MLYKLTKKMAYFVCPCGSEFDVDLADLRALPRQIILPACKDCGRISTLLCVQLPTDENELKKVPKQVIARNRINHTLLKRLIEIENFGNMGQKQFKAEDFAEWMYSEAADDDMVEAPLHTKINSAHKDKKRQKKALAPEEG